MNALKRAVIALAALLLANPATAALLSIAQYPLFLTHRTLPNVLVIYDNSESMDATMAGKLIAGDDPTTRGNIARSVIRNTVSNFAGQFNWGLESFGIGGAGLYSTYPYWLGNDQTMVFTDDCVSGISASNNGLRCIDNPQWAGSVGDRYVTYDRASDDPDINDVLYIGYFGSGAWATTAGGGAYNFYFTHNPGTAFEANMTNYWATLSFTPTDAGYIPYNPPISRQLYAYRAWGFYAGVTGQGVINEPIQGPSASGTWPTSRRYLPPKLRMVRILRMPLYSRRSPAACLPRTNTSPAVRRRSACRARRASSCSRPTATRPPISGGTCIRWISRSTPTTP